MAIAPSRRSRITKQDPREPNLIPIMNLFIVVIPMLMTMMVAVHLSMLEITLSTGSGGGGQTEEKEAPPKEITLGLFTDKFELRVEGTKDVIQIPIDKKEYPQYNYVKLDESIAELKRENERQNAIKIVPDPKVKFDTLLRTIDICKDNGFPDIIYSPPVTKHYRVK